MNQHQSRSTIAGGQPTLVNKCCDTQNWRQGISWVESVNNKHEELSHDFEARDDFRKDFMLQDTEINMSSLKGTIKNCQPKMLWMAGKLKSMPRVIRIWLTEITQVNDKNSTNIQAKDWYDTKIRWGLFVVPRRSPLTIDVKLMLGQNPLKP